MFILLQNHRLQVADGLCVRLPLPFALTSTPPPSSVPYPALAVLTMPSPCLSKCNSTTSPLHCHLQLPSPCPLPRRRPPHTAKLACCMLLKNCTPPTLATYNTLVQGLCAASTPLAAALFTGMPPMAANLVRSPTAPWLMASSASAAPSTPNTSSNQ